MRRYIAILALLGAVAALAVYAFFRAGSKENPIAMLLTSPSFEEGAAIPVKFTCDGASINPELAIQNVPEDAKSLALIIHDPDAPLPGGFTHWTVWNIDPRTVLIKEESVPPGSVEGVLPRINKPGYAGMCPPKGDAAHHYHFMLFALKNPLSLPAETTPDALRAMIDTETIAKAELIGTYVRQ